MFKLPFCHDQTAYIKLLSYGTVTHRVVKFNGFSAFFDKIILSNWNVTHLIKNKIDIVTNIKTS